VEKFPQEALITHDAPFCRKGLLPSLYTQPKIPVAKTDIPTQDDIDSWPHLNSIVQITSLHPSTEIGLLLASDVPEALDPQEVIHSQHGGPYATRTKLGWVINGPLRRCQELSQASNFSVRTDVKLNYDGILQSRV